MKNKEIKKIAILKGPGIGDVITSIPLLRNLRKNFPESDITIFNEVSYGAGKEVLKKCPYISKTIEINQRSIISMLKAIGKIRKEKFDIIIDSFPSTWKTALFCYMSGAKIKMGYCHNPLSFLYSINARYTGQNKVDLEAALLEKLGIKISEKGRKLELFFDLRKSGKKLSEALKKNSIKASDTVIGIHAGRTDDLVRTWEDDRWAKLCDMLIDKHKAKIIFIGSKSDEERAGTIIKMMKNACTNLSGKLNLEEAATLINKLDLFLCINGGLMHIAAALKKPLIALCGDSKPGWDPYGKNSHVIRKNQNVFRNTYYKKGDNRYMKMIEVDDVKKKIEELKVLK